MSGSGKDGQGFRAVMRLFDEALEQPRENRAAWLEARRSEDPILVQEVIQLVAAHEDGDSLPELPSELLSAAQPSSTSELESLPEWIGRYRVLERIAEGGMGTVYKAEQREPMRRIVAVKLVRSGMDSRDVLNRFDAERQALALMDHPNIARVLDGGLTDQGRPYFAMEYVPGEPLVSFCDGRRLSLGDRLVLFVKVCAAVQHAHQKGVIHRDLKPSNVLVIDGDDGPEPKVIDFGIAKAIGQRLTDAPLKTAHGMLLGTPEYMSPEQAGMHASDLDTRTDVFSLGVLLYELLVGRLPFERGARQRMDEDPLRHPRRDPPRPSAHLKSLSSEERELIARDRVSSETRLFRELDRDLDWVVLHALESERDRRYSSVSEFAADIVRYLAGDAVEAGPPSLRYRVSKFVRRHRLAVSSTAALALVVVSAAIALGIQTTRLGRALEEAEQQAQRAEAVSQVLVDAFQSADPLQRQLDREVTAREVLERAVEALDVETLVPEDRAWLARAMGSAFLGINDLDRAESLLDDAATLSSASDDETLSDALIARAWLYAERSEFARALTEAEAALEQAERSGRAPQRATSRRAVAMALDRLGRFDDARLVLEEALAIAEASPDVDATTRAQLALDLATNAHRRSDYDAALSAGRSAVEFAERAWANPLRHLESRFLLMRALFETGGRAEALEISEQDYATALERLGGEHPRTTTLRNAFAVQLNQSPRISEALPLHLENVAIARRDDPEGAQLPSHLNNLGLTQLGLGRLTRAEATNREALRLQLQLVGPEHPNPGYHHMNLARVLHAQARYTEAEQEYRTAHELWVRLLPEGHTLRGNVAIWLGGLLVETGRAREGLALIEEGLAIRESDRGRDDWQTAEAQSWYGAALAETGETEPARQLLEQAYATIEQQRGTDWLRTRWAHARVLHFHRLVGDAPQTQEWADRFKENYGEPPSLTAIRWSLF